MSKLTDEQIDEVIDAPAPVTAYLTDGRWKLRLFARAIESAATEPLLQRIAELEANEKVLLAQVQGHTKWREKIVKASEQAYGESAIRYKFSLTKTGKCMNTFPKEIDGRWFALVPAEDDGHIGHIARITELERQLEEARNQALEEAAKVCDDIAADLRAWKDPYGAEIAISARDAIRALKGAKE